ncbi:ATP-binding domain-containing protein [Burkholderia vietnamiensis]|uniref:ATP-binding domain-containing protein n=1 Tax=Burkholderia vietnamiensis TaxID=60552 RepID=UPI00075E74AE|nr:ATP-binding domain-containing protein [Burkholderia vietnamiensis]KVR98554.1 hypothetical protein WK28_05700 [Burkholderia vietnamiensis]
MRLPKLRQLTEAQKKVYLYAPTNRHTLVSGPPGTGKTLIACLRAVELRKKRDPVVLCMFSRVLAQYSSNAGDDDAIHSTTVHRWFRQWWSRSGVPPHRAADNIAVNVNYDERAIVKAAGARWDPGRWSPWRRKPGVWVVDGQSYYAAPDVFAQRQVSHDPPVVEGNRYNIDWNAVAAHLFEHEDCIPASALDLGTIMIDEGQDFAPGFYRTMRVIGAIAGGRGDAVSHPPRCFILADENQQITTENSTLKQIAEELRIADGNRYALCDNFRNSREIAELALQFFADVGDRPLLPARSSERPLYSQVAGMEDAIGRIVTWVRNNPGKEVGVLVFEEAMRGALTAGLRTTLSGVRGRAICVQSYSWAAREEHRVEDLVFDVGDVVTVLNMQSCKGLEFDAVFVVDPWRAQIGLYGADRFKMQMFVAVSRAREWVQLIDCGTAAGAAAHQVFMPGPEFLDREGGSERKQAVLLPLAAVVAPPARKEAPAKLDWERVLANLTEKHGFATIDARGKGGALWVIAGKEFAAELEPLGFAFSEGRLAWWRK